MENRKKENIENLENTEKIENKNKKQKKSKNLRKQLVFNRAVPINILGIILCALIYVINFLIYRDKYQFKDQIADIFIYVLLVCNPILYLDYKRALHDDYSSKEEQRKMDNIFIATIFISELIFIVKIVITLLIQFKII